MRATIHTGDCREVLRSLEPESVQCVVTSPPYWGLRDYGVAGQMGLEPSPKEYVAQMVDVFREIRRVLKPDGTVWLNLGDTYFGGGMGGNPAESPHRKQATNAGSLVSPPAWKSIHGLKPKDLIGIPWRVAFGLQEDGWWLRSDIIWAKPNPMPESVTDRPSRSHEYIFLLTKSARYYYDVDAVRTEPAETSKVRWGQDIDTQHGSDRAHGGAKNLKAVGGPRRTDKQRGHERKHAGFNDRWDSMSREEQQAMGANLRDVWTVATHPYSGAHFATFPPKLIEPCIKAGSREGDLVLDPFTGAGTTGMVATRLDRQFVGVEMNPEYADMARQRIINDAPLFMTGAVQ